jgi:hypothetical protein
MESIGKNTGILYRDMDINVIQQKEKTWLEIAMSRYNNKTIVFCLHKLEDEAINGYLHSHLASLSFRMQLSSIRDYDNQIKLLNKRYSKLEYTIQHMNTKLVNVESLLNKVLIKLDNKSMDSKDEQNSKIIVKDYDNLTSQNLEYNHNSLLYNKNNEIGNKKFKNVYSNIV